MTGFPGLDTGVDGTPYIDPDGLSATLHDICTNGAGLLIVLTEEEELPDGAYDLLKTEAKAKTLDLNFLPIQDFQAPDADGLTQWHTLRNNRTDMPSDGGTIAFSCQYGAGRSGLMAALCLLEKGVGLQTAVATVRQHFSEAIESDVQMAWLTEVSAELKDESQTLDLD